METIGNMKDRPAILDVLNDIQKTARELAGLLGNYGMRDFYAIRESLYEMARLADILGHEPAAAYFNTIGDKISNDKRTSPTGADYRRAMMAVKFAFDRYVESPRHVNGKPVFPSPPGENEIWRESMYMFHDGVKTPDRWQDFLDHHGIA